MPKNPKSSYCSAMLHMNILNQQKPVLGVHYAHRYSRKPPTLGRCKKYTLFENMRVRGL